MKSGIFLAIVVGATNAASADTIHVPDDFPTIQEAIDAAMDGDEVEVDPGTYNETINFLGKAITVYSTDGADVTIIDAQQTGTVVTCDSAEGPESVLEGFTITGGIGGFGGGMRNINSSPTVTNCTFSGNTANFRGGGVSNTSNSSPTFISCSFTDNGASDSGGGMINDASSPTLISCSFTDNAAGGFGAGMSNYASNPILTECIFSGNNSFFQGGGMYNDASSPTLNDAVFTQNGAHCRGGGMYNRNSSPALTNCQFTGNSTPDDGGGGMFNAVNSNPTVTGCTFSGNFSAIGGGMNNQSNSNPIVIDCTFSGNRSDDPGGGMFNKDSSPTVTNCTFIGNTVCFGGVGGGMYSAGNSNPPIADSFFCGNDPDNIGGRWTDDGGNEFLDDCPCPWDLDGSGSVGASDLLALLVSWGPCKDCPADFDGNGSVGAADLLSLLVNWGPCP